MKHIFWLPIALLLLSSPSLLAQSPAQSDISRLNSSLKMLAKLDAAPDWDNTSYQTRYESYLKKAEAAVENIEKKDPAYELGALKAQVKGNRSRFAANKKDSGGDDRAAYWAQREQEKAAQKEKRAAEEQRARQQADSIRKAVEAQMQAHQTQYESEEAVKAAERAREERQAASNPRPMVDQRPAGTVSVSLKNTCTTAIKYCIDDGSSVRFFTIGANETALRYTRPGSQVCRISEGRKGGVIGVVGATDGGKIFICTR